MEVPKPSRETAAREARARDLHAVLAAAEAAFRRRLFLAEGRAALDYLRRRGLTDETIARFGLGWSGEGRGALAADLKAEGIEPAQLAEAGLMKPRDPDGDARGGYVDLFFNRVMFPIRDRRGRTISFGGRILGDGQPKYVNGPETALFQKRRSLYGLDLAKEGAFRGAALVAVEGYMDVIALHQAGFTGAVAPLGTALTAEQLQAMWQVSPEPLLCFDGDAAGARAAARAAELALPLLAPERSLRLATLPSGEDPDTLVLKQGPRAFQAVLDAARPLSAALYVLMAEGVPAQGATPEQRASLRHRLVAAAEAIPDKALAAEYRRALVDRFFAAQQRRTGFAARTAGRGAGRGGAHPAIAGVPRLQRIAVDLSAVRLERARNLLAVLLRHPALLPEVEEPFASLDLPGGACDRLRTACLSALSESQLLDSSLLMAQLAEGGLAEDVAWATRPAGLCAGASADAQPAEALDAWWHFFGLLRGEAELIADRAEAERMLVETNDPAAQQRLIRLKEALDSLRGGEMGQGPAA
jgi:DNA primase